MSAYLTGFERAWLSSHRAVGPFYAHILLEGEGTPDPSAWTQAMRVTSEVIPRMSSRVAGMACGTRWIPGPPPPVEPLEPFDGLPSDRVLRPPCDLYERSGTALQVGEGRWLLRFSHATTDGRGAIGLCKALFAARRGEPVVPVGCRSEREVVGPGPSEFPPDKDAVPPMGPPSDAGDAPIWERRSIGPVRSGVLGHVLAALPGLCGPCEGPVRVELPVDLRPSEEGDAVGNVTGMMAIDIPRDATPEALREGIVRDVRAGRPAARVRGADIIRHTPVWLTDFIAKRSVTQHRTQSRFATTGVVSNVGRVGLEPFRCDDFEARRLAVIPTYAPVTAVFLALTGGTWGAELVGVSPARFGGEGRLGAWMDAVAAVARSQDLN